jgi:hypothetical protein
MIPLRVAAVNGIAAGLVVLPEKNVVKLFREQNGVICSIITNAAHHEKEPDP